MTYHDCDVSSMYNYCNGILIEFTVEHYASYPNVARRKTELNTANMFRFKIRLVEIG